MYHQDNPTEHYATGTIKWIPIFSPKPRSDINEMYGQNSDCKKEQYGKLTLKPKSKAFNKNILLFSSSEYNSEIWLLANVEN